MKLENILSGVSNPKRRKKYNDHDEKIKQFVYIYNEIPEFI